MLNRSFREIATDRAIERSEQDDFDRENFALYLAQGIAQRQNRSSFVVALQGAWGCGKSSIKNMTLEKLGTMENAPYVVQFEPWQLRDADSLFATFFGEIALALKEEAVGEDENEKAQARKEKLLGYSKSLAFGGSVVKSLGILAGITSIPLAKLIELTGEKMGDMADVAEKGGNAVGIPEEKSLRDQKRELSDLLAELKRPILVVIDDIDRLEVAEMVLLFQLVKANADFPNFTYLLLLQCDRVRDGLVEHMGDYGCDYLDKIIQLPIDVPPANATQRFALLQHGVEELFELWNLTLSDDERKDIGLLWGRGLDELLAQPRDVVRVLNAVEFTLAVMKTEAGLEINLTDALALESIRVLEPATYGRLATVKHLLVGERPKKRSERQGPAKGIYDSMSGKISDTLADDKQPGQAEMNEALKKLSSGRRQAVNHVLEFVFPQASWALETRVIVPNGPRETRPSGRWRAKDKFDRYFNLAIPSDQISQADLARFLDALAASDIVALNQQMENFLLRGLHQTFFWELYGEVINIPQEQSLTLLSTQLDFWERRPEHPGLGRLFTVALIPQKDAQKKGKLLQQVFEQSSAYGIPSSWLLRQGNSLQKSDRFNPEVWTDETHFEKMRELILARVTLNVNTPEFWDVPRPLNAIELWFSVEPEQVRTWVASQIESDSQLPLFLERFSDHESFIDETSAERAIVFEWPIFDWFDVAALKERVEAIDTSGLNILASAARQQFVRYAEGWLENQARLKAEMNASTEDAATDNMEESGVQIVSPPDQALLA